MDPRSGLASKDVTERAEAVRALATVGTADDVEGLIALGRSDRSPSVRLYAAAAAAHLALQHADEVDSRGWCTQVMSEDPVVNPGLLMVLAASPVQATVKRLGRLLRDPRSGVRVGAAMAVRRLGLSAGAALDPVLREAAAGWIHGGRHPPDAVLELVKLAGELGWCDFDAALDTAREAGRLHGEQVALATERIAYRRDLARWDGLWVSYGADPFQPEKAPAPEGWWVLSGGEASGSGDRSGALTAAGSGHTLCATEVRWVWAQRVGEEGARPAIQQGVHLFWRQDGKALLQAVPPLIDGIAAAGRSAAVAVAGWLGDVEGTVAPRVRAELLWRGRALPEAEELLAPLAEAKRPSAAVLWILAEVKVGLGDLDSARELVARALASAPKRAPWRRDAESLQASLGG